MLKSVRASTTELLRSLDEDDWARSGTHTESGPYSVQTWLAIYAAHAHDHAGQISRARLCRHSLVNHRVISDRVIRRR